MTFAVSSTCSRKYRSRPSVISACISTGFSTALVVIESSASNLSFVFSPSDGGNHPTMASANFCYPIPTPYDAGSQWQDNRSPKVMRVTFPLTPAASTSAVFVQVLGFGDNGLLTHCGRLVCDFCSSGQCAGLDCYALITYGSKACRRYLRNTPRHHP